MFLYFFNLFQDTVKTVRVTPSRKRQSTEGILKVVNKNKNKDTDFNRPRCVNKERRGE